MGKKQATDNIRNLHYAIAIIDETTGKVTYNAPEKISDFQKIKISVSSNTDKHYADGGVCDVINNFEGGKAEIDTYGIDNKTIALIEGHKVDANGVMISSAEDEAPYIALGFEAMKRNKKKRFVWLLLCKKSLGSEEYETRKGKSDPKGTNLSFELIQREDGIWKYTIDEDDENAPKNLNETWFKKVYDGSFSV
jgi:phi13 family phage major tail protein